MFARGGWNHRVYQRVLNALNQLLPEALFDVHTDSVQNVQGGTTGEHYHLNELEHVFVLWAKNQPIYYEPTMDLTGEIMLDGNGDIMMSAGPSYAP